MEFQRSIKKEGKNVLGGRRHLSLSLKDARDEEGEMLEKGGKRILK